MLEGPIRWLALVALASCQSPAVPQPASVASTPPANVVDAALADAPDAAVVAPDGAIANIRGRARETPSPGASGQDLEALKQMLGRSITTCFVTAKLIAQQGSTTSAGRQWRERAVLRRCVDDKWPLRVRECVATATHDQLACTAYLEHQRQRARWNAVFDKWIR